MSITMRAFKAPGFIQAFTLGAFEGMGRQAAGQGGANGSSPRQADAFLTGSGAQPVDTKRESTAYKLGSWWAGYVVTAWIPGETAGPYVVQFVDDLQEVLTDAGPTAQALDAAGDFVEAGGDLAVEGLEFLGLT
jgi:hypothetical protein